MNKTDEALAKILTQLSDKFGTTSAHLWQVLLRQAWIDGVECAIGILLTMIPAIILLVKIWRSYKSYDNKRNDFFEEHIPITLLTIVATMTFIVTFFMAGSSAMDAILNPEYYALHEILKSK